MQTVKNLFLQIMFHLFIYLLMGVAQKKGFPIFFISVMLDSYLRSTYFLKIYSL